MNSNNPNIAGFWSRIDGLYQVLLRPENQNLFLKLVYIWFLGHAIYLSTALNVLWGPEALLMPMIRQGDGAMKNVMYILNYLRSYSFVVMAIHLVSALIALLGYFRFYPRILVVISGWMLYYSAIPAFNSGFLLMMLFGSFAIFMNPRANKPAAILLSNLAFIAAIVQFILVYAVASLYKFEGTTWLNGTSLHYVLYYRPLVNEGPANFLHQFPTMLKAFTYVGLVYQTSFGLLIWVKCLKRPLLIIGFCFHLFIGMVMHLWDFAFAMIFAYALFIDLPNVNLDSFGFKKRANTTRG